MDESHIIAATDWLIRAGLDGFDENELVNGLCRRCCEAGLDLSRGLAIVDTLHPSFEGRAFSWRDDEDDRHVALEYGRTEGEAAETWRHSVFFHLLENDLPEWYGVFGPGTLPFPQIEAMRAEGHSAVLAMVHRFAGESVFGEMDCVYSNWSTRRRGGFAEADLAALRRLTPPLALAIKSRSLARVTQTLADVYLGRGAGRRVLSGRIRRGVAERIETVLWFSDLRGFTSITDQASPDEIIPLLNDYADAVISSVHDHEGDVLKLVGDGVLAIFEAADLADACGHALAAESDLRGRLATLNGARASEARPVTSVYLGLHVGEVFFGNIGSQDRLDFTVVGPAVNEVNRIASFCRSADRSCLMSARFAGLAAGSSGVAVASVGRFALRGVRQAQELFTLDRSDVA